MRTTLPAPKVLNSDFIKIYFFLSFNGLLICLGDEKIFLEHKLSVSSFFPQPYPVI